MTIVGTPVPDPSSLDPGTWNITDELLGKTLTGTIPSLACNESVTVTVEAAIDDHTRDPDPESVLLSNNVTVETITPESDWDNNVDWANIFPFPLP